MDFYEFEGKNVFRKYDIKTSKEMLLKSIDDLKDFTYPCVVKSQVLSGKRGKAGGIKFAHNYEEMEAGVKEIFAMDIYGNKVDAILVAEMIDIAKEYYLGITIDPINKQSLLMFSPYGGMEIEELAEEEPDKIFKMNFTSEIDKDVLLEGIGEFNLDENIEKQLIEIIENLVRLFNGVDATTVEINPLAVDGDNNLIAIDAKLVIDDNALFRQDEYQLIDRQEDKVEGINKNAKDADLIYVDLDDDGNIGLIAGGAGIGMATMDTIRYYGGKPVNFLDLGGGVTSEKTKKAMELLLTNEKVEGVVVNIFGGINNCQVMAKGIKAAVEEFGQNQTVVVKSRGHSQEEGWAIYEELGIHQVKHGTTDDAVNLLLEKMEVR
jgi:succinyl-CoA synthetase beta subunit